MCNKKSDLRLSIPLLFAISISFMKTTKNDDAKVFQDIGNTWNKVFQKFSANETLCFSRRNKVFLRLKQSVSSTDTVIGLLRQSKTMRLAKPDQPQVEKSMANVRK